MDEAWKVLCVAGVPDGPARPQNHHVDLAQVRRAVEAIASGVAWLPGERREPLLSWLRAFAHHFPTRFDAELGTAGAALAAAIESLPLDRNRYLKLRRIAVENLSRWL